MKIRSLILCLMCALLLVACGKGSATTSVEATAAPTTVPTAGPTAAPTQAPQIQQVVIAAATNVPTEVPATPKPTPEPTPVPTPEPTPTPVPRLGVLDGKYYDKFVTGAPVIVDTAEAKSYQSEKVAIFITRVVDDTKTITDHTYNYYMADVYFQDMEDFKSAPARSWKQRWDTEWLVNIAKSNDAVFAVSGDFTISRNVGLAVRNGELLVSKHDTKRDVGVIYKDGHMETYTAQNAPAEQLTTDPEVWQILGFGPELLDENGQSKTKFNDPNKVNRANIRNAVGYFEPGHYCFVYVPPYRANKSKPRSDGSCLDLGSLSKLMCSLGCVRAYNLDGGATAGMFFNGKLVTESGLGPERKNQDIYYIPKA